MDGQENLDRTWKVREKSQIAVPKIQRDSNSHYPMAIRLWETFTSTF